MRTNQLLISSGFLEPLNMIDGSVNIYSSHVTGNSTVHTALAFYREGNISYVPYDNKQEMTSHQLCTYNPFELSQISKLFCVFLLTISVPLTSTSYVTSSTLSDLESKMRARKQVNFLY